jgi:hypothetical protein
MGMLLRANGTQEEIKPAGKRFTLAEMQSLVGGQIELTRTVGGQLMLMNEEGKLQRLPFNRKASALFAQDQILGDVVLLDPGELD